MAGNTPKAAATAKVTLKSKQKHGIKRPVISILMPDGRVAEFKDRGIVIPDSVNEGGVDQQVFAVLVNGEGLPFVTPDGELAVTAVPVVGLEVLADPNKLVTFADVVRLSGASISTVKRDVKNGLLPTPAKQREGGRSVRFRYEDVAAYLNSNFRVPRAR